MLGETSIMFRPGIIHGTERFLMNTSEIIMLLFYQIKNKEKLHRSLKEQVERMLA